MTRISRFTFRAWLLAFLWLVMAGAHAAIDRAVLAPLGNDDADARIEAVGHIAALATPDARRVLDALNNETLYVTPTGDVLVVDDDKAWNPVTDATTAVPDDAEDISVNNRLRSVLQGALSGMRLFSEDRGERLAAARAMTRNADPAQLPLIEKALEKEKDAEVIAQLEQVRAIANLTADDAAKRKAALITLRNTTDASLMGMFRDMAEKKPDGSYQEPDAEVRAEATKTVAALQNHLRMTDIAGKVFYGLSLGSVLLLAALGLAITFGLMGIINMAHGEMLMIGAYTTYLCQLFFRAYFPEAIDAYLLLALPAAFIVTAAVGIVIERLVIRWLYGRPLETLLCTWGISLMLMQGVRTLFGAQNVEVANPSWMSGGITVMGSLALSWNRIIIIVFSLLVVLAVWLILNKTRLGLFLRAVTQNRRMADCVGVSTGRIDMMTFGLGCGIAGLGGVALSQLGNVGPDLGQAYIVDSFMVVVLGGVGQLAGTVIAAFGLGEITKFLEPVAGAVLAKIAILVVIIVFIQKRPQGLFALKGRSVE